jgi:SAM-dependent methyltransferase
VPANEKEAYVRLREGIVRPYYRELAPEYADWLRRRAYYYRCKADLIRRLVPEPGRTLEIGCGLGQNLAALAPQYGLGIDLCPEIVDEARALHPSERYPHIEFQCLSALDCEKIQGPFETILLINCTTEIADIASAFRAIRTLCAPHTRIVQISYNYFLAPVIRLAARMGWAPRHPVQNWLTRHDLSNLAYLTGFEEVRQGYSLPLPVWIPLVSAAVNRILPLFPPARYVSLLYYTVLRPLQLSAAGAPPSVTVCVPCKDEEHNIEGLVLRIPDMGSALEIIFVDDRSTDGTREAIRTQIALHPEKQIRLVTGPGEGKGAACRAGFADAAHDVLMILDADMTVMPEDLPGFYEALASGKGELINGSRLVYPMENRAMRFLNVMGNKMFAALFSYLLSQSIKDTLCGTKVCWRRDYPKILEARAFFGGIDRWGDYDWLFGAARHNLRIVEYPVLYRERVAGETKMTQRLRNGLTMLRMCWEAFRRLRT